MIAAIDRYDAIIFGTGAGGGTLAYRLAAMGKTILVLERGDFLHLGRIAGVLQATNETSQKQNQLTI